MNCSLRFLYIKLVFPNILSFQNAGIKIEQNIKALETNEVKLEEIEEDLSELSEQGSIKLGVPKEIFKGEKRVSIVPSTVRKLVK